MQSCAMPHSKAHLVGLSVAVLLSLFLGTLARAQDTADWSGAWDSLWRDGGARLLLEQNGTRVTGVYPLYNGRIEAEAVGRELRGRWIERSASGEFVFVQSSDGKTFTGRFSTGEWWTGARIATDSGTVEVVDQTTPAETMRSFLIAANRAAAGDIEAIGTAVALIRPADPVASASDPFDLARALFGVVDQTTFRLWDIPRALSDGPDRISAVLRQAGTGEQVSVDFIRDAGEWYLEAPSAEALDATAERLRSARAGAEGALPGGPLSSPRATMRSFLTGFGFAADGSDPATLATLDLRGRPGVTKSYDGQVLAGYLRRVIDRAGYVLWQEIPDDPAATEPYVHFLHPEGSVVIAPVETADGVIWQFTPETLRTIRKVYAAVEDMPVAEGLVEPSDGDLHFAIRDSLRGIVPDALGQVGPLERWQWGGLLGTALGVLGLGWLVRVAVRRLRSRAGADAGVSDDPAAGLFVWSFRALVAGLVILAATWVLGLPEQFSTVLATVALLLIVVGLILLGWRGISALADRYRDGGTISGHNLILVSLASGVLKGALIVFAVLAVAQALSLPLTGVLAGFGIGGLAVALAAQPTLQNLLSGFTLYADRPISVGDFCRFGDKMGTVEEIGLRSTRLRTMDRTVISVPNAQFLDMQLENFTRRDRFYFSTILQLRYETTPDQMRFVLAELRKLLIAHPMVVPEPMRVRFKELGAHSLDIELFCYILAADGDVFAAVREDVLLRIMTAVEEAGAQFAFPSMVQYAATDIGPDPDRVREIEAAVEKWRTDETLPFPDFEWQTKAEISGTLDYPPVGSVLRREETLS
jgi:MscS family membrane protein